MFVLASLPFVRLYVNQLRLCSVVTYVCNLMDPTNPARMSLAIGLTPPNNQSKCLKMVRWANDTLSGTSQLCAESGRFVKNAVTVFVRLMLLTTLFYVIVLFSEMFLVCCGVYDWIYYLILNNITIPWHAYTRRYIIERHVLFQLGNDASEINVRREVATCYGGLFSDALSLLFGCFYPRAIEASDYTLPSQVLDAEEFFDLPRLFRQRAVRTSEVVLDRDFDDDLNAFQRRLNDIFERPVPLRTLREENNILLGIREGFLSDSDDSSSDDDDDDYSDMPVLIPAADSFSSVRGVPSLDSFPTFVPNAIPVVETIEYVAWADMMMSTGFVVSIVTFLITLVCMFYDCFVKRREWRKIDEQIRKAHPELVENLLTFGSNKSKFKNQKKNLFETFDGNPSNNLDRMFHKKFLKTIPFGDTKIKLNLIGYTICDRGRLNFPVYCDKKQFLEQVMPDVMRMSRSDYFDFSLGLMTEKNFHLFHRILSPMPQYDLSTLTLLGSVFMQFCVLFTSEFWYLFFIMHFIVGFLLEFVSYRDLALIAPFYEEFFKHFVGGPTFATFEAIEKIQKYGYSMRVFRSFAIHCCLGYIPWLSVRIFIHFLWNLYFVNAIDSCTFSTSLVDFEKQISMVEEFSRVTNLIRMLCLKDITGMFAAIMSNVTWYMNICNILGESIDISDIWSFIPVDFATAGEVVGLEGEQSRVSFFIDRMRSLLPRWVSHSPVYAKLTALIVLITSSTFITTSSVFLKLSKFFDFSELDLLSTAAEPLTVFFSVIKGVFCGFQRVYETGSWRDFFDLPRDVYFVVEATKFLYEAEKPLTEEQMLSNYAFAQRLIDDRLYSVNSTEINRKLDGLRKYVTDVKVRLKDLTVRTPPIVILMKGEPGVGKTTLIENTIDYVAVLLNMVRFVGDVINYNVWDKFPISSGMHKSAKYLVINDAPDIYSDFPMKDLMPMDVIIQRVVDTAPLDFRCAAVDDKGKMFNDIVLVIITCNSASFVCPGPTEKCQRRLEYGVLVDVSVKTDNKTLQHKEFSKMTPGERNSSWNFNILDVRCVNRHISFFPTQLNYRIDGYLEYLGDRVLKYHERAKREKELFFNKKALCDCGCSIALHRMRLSMVDTDLPEEQCVQWGEDSWVSNSLRCDDFIVEYNNQNKLTRKVRLYATKAHFLMNKKVLAYSASTVLAFVSFLCGYTLVVLATFLVMVISSNLTSYCTEEMLESTALKVVQIVSKVNEFMELDPIRRCELLAKEYYLRFVLWCRQKLKLLLMLCGAGGAAMFIKYMIKRNVKIDGLANPIYEKDVDPDSMIVTNYRQEANFPEILRREWGKTESVMNRVDLMTLGTSMDALETIVRNQLQRCYLLLEGESKERCQIQFLLLSNDFFAINRHYLFDENGAPRCHKFTLFPKAWPHSFFVKDMISDPTVEWVMFRHNMPFVCRSLMNYFPKDPVKYQIDVTRVSSTGSHKAVASPINRRFLDRSYDSLEWNDSLVAGDCMSVLLGRFHSGVGIIGFVYYGLNSSVDNGNWTRVGATLACQEVFSRMVKPLDEPIVNDCSLLGGNFQVIAVDEHSDVRNVESPFLDVLGTEPGATNHFRSSKRRSRWYDHFYSKLSKGFDYAKKVSGLTKDGIYKSAFQHTMEGFGKGADFPVELGIKAADSYLEDCFPQSFVDEMKIRATPVKLTEAFFGVAELGISRICFKTSCGITCREAGIKNKYDMFVEYEPGKYRFDEGVKERIQTTLDKWEKGILTIPRAEYVAKDEIRTTEKLDDYKVRLFTNLEAEFNLPTRMMTISIVVLFLMYPKRTECYGGMNAGSKQWDEFATWILHEDFLQLDMDFKCFDSSHNLGVYRVIAYFMFKLSLRLGYTVKAAFSVYICVRSGSIQFMRYILTWFLKYGGLSSGWILTLFFNSVENSILMRMAFDTLVEDVSKGNFQKFVRVGTVGDDNASGVAKSISHLFNLLTIAPLYKKWGYDVTTAKKDANMSAFVDPSELQFVKRKFVFNELLNGYVAPLDKDSIYKALCFEDKKIGVTPVQRLVDVALNAQREAFLHGKEFFFQFQSELKVASLATDIDVKMLDFDSLMLEYTEERFSTFDC